MWILINYLIIYLILTGGGPFKSIKCLRLSIAVYKNIQHLWIHNTHTRQVEKHFVGTIVKTTYSIKVGKGGVLIGLPHKSIIIIVVVVLSNRFMKYDYY